MNSIFKTKDKVFYFCLISTFVVLGIIIYISITSQSTEEFAELYWQVFKVENLRQTVDIVIDQKNRSQSDSYIVGDLWLFAKKYKVVVINSSESKIYDSLCIDANNNGSFCGNDEGPWKTDGTFFIDSRPYHILKLNKDDVILANYPKEVNISDFNVTFTVKSHYMKNTDFDVRLFINESFKTKKILTIEPNKMKISSFEVNLPDKGLYNVKIVLKPKTLNESTEIYFWVLKS